MPFTLEAKYRKSTRVRTCSTDHFTHGANDSYVVSIGVYCTSTRFRNYHRQPNGKMFRFGHYLDTSTEGFE